MWMSIVPFSLIGLGIPLNPSSRAKNGVLADAGRFFARGSGAGGRRGEEDSVREDGGEEKCELNFQTQTQIRYPNQAPQMSPKEV